MAGGFGMGLTIIATILQRPATEEIFTPQKADSSIRRPIRRHAGLLAVLLAVLRRVIQCSAPNSTAPWLYMRVVAGGRDPISEPPPSLAACWPLPSCPVWARAGGTRTGRHAVNWTAPSDHLLTRFAASGLDWLAVSQTLGYGSAACAGTAQRRREPSAAAAMQGAGGGHRVCSAASFRLL